MRKEKTKHPVYLKFTQIVGSKYFFIALLILIFVQGVWFAVSYRYPISTEEETHVELIKYYDGSLDPFYSSQSEYLFEYGEVIRNPSYLSNYLLSLPFGLSMDYFTQNQTIILLRIINTALFLGAIIYFKRSMTLLKGSPALANLSLFIFASLPISTMLAGSVHYDNAAILVSSMIIFYALKIINSTNASLQQYLMIVCLVLFGSLIKYTVLVLGIPVLIIVLINFFRNSKKKNFVPKDLAKKTLSVATCMIILFLVFLVAERHVRNIYEYKSISPRCDQIASIEVCKKNNTWLRNYNLSRAESLNSTNPFEYLGIWTELMIGTSYYVMSILPDGRSVIVGPMPIPHRAFQLFAVFGLILIIAYHRDEYRKSLSYRFLFIVSVIFLATVFIDNYDAYIRYGKPVAVNGRYLLPILPFIIYYSVGYASKAIGKKIHIKVLLFMFIVFTFIQGGGMIGHTVRSDNSWLWPESSVVRYNNNIRNVLKPIVVEKWLGE